MKLIDAILKFKKDNRINSYYMLGYHLGVCEASIKKVLRGEQIRETTLEEIIRNLEQKGFLNKR